MKSHDVIKRSAYATNGQAEQHNTLQKAHYSTGQTVEKRKRPSRRLPPLERVLGYVVILVVAFVFLFPLAYLLNVALHDPKSFFNNPTSFTTALRVENFAAAWEKGNFGSYFFNTVMYSLSSTLLSTAFALLLAFPIARGYVKYSAFFYLLFVAAMFLPNGLIPQFQLMLNLGLYDTQLGYILLKSGAVGLGPFLITGYLKSLPRELDEAAAIDGCGYFRYIWEIIVPLTKPVLVTVFLLDAIGVWNDIIGPTIYFATEEYYPVARGLFAFYGEFSTDWVGVAAATFIVAAPLIVLFLVLQRYFISGALGGAFKS